MNLRRIAAHAVGVALDETTRPEDVQALCEVFGATAPHRERRGQRDRRRRGRDRPRGAAPHQPVPHPSGVQPLPLRDRDAALHAPARVARSVADPVDDPARLVHHEAERHRRDGADHLAGVRNRLHPFAPADAGGRLSRDLQAARGDGWPRSPASPRCRCSRTPARRASTPACWSFAPYHQSRGQQAAQHLPDPVVGARHQSRQSAAMAGFKVVVVACDDQRQRRPRRSRAQGRASTATGWRR